MLDAAEIESVAVYPPIGLARVGNAAGPDDYFFASEVIGGLPTPPVYRDDEGRIRRQAVRFRIYAKLKSGSFVEVTAHTGATIEWRVEVANLKAGWYEFKNAMDLPDGISKPARRRNAAQRSRAKLDIRPARQVISGRGVSGPEHVFREGQFFNRFVTLGEVRTDDQGRLIFLGGRGNSAPFLEGMRPLTFANNDGWHDDVCDGPVRARVEIGGKSFEAEPGYVVVAPPNFAPGLFGVVTMNDVVRETFLAFDPQGRPTTTRFARDVWPIFQRLTQMQWVNHGLFILHGAGSPLDAYASGTLDRMRSRSAEASAWRQRVFALFRDPGSGGSLEPHRIPEIFGDTFGDADEHARARLAVTPIMYEHLKRWARDEFTDDWTGPPSQEVFEGLSADQQVEHLTQCGLYECLGGPFHPGIELSWPLRQRSLWTSPYRLALVAEGRCARQDYGDELTPQVCLSAHGPLSAVGPGALTRWLGVPWQTDEASCNSGAEYMPSTFLSMPSYWGARVPDQVLSAESWERAIAHENSGLQRHKHFAHRSDWLRDVRERDYYGRIQTMVLRWWTLGMLTEEPTPSDLPDGLPRSAFVESGRHRTNAGSDPKVKLTQIVERVNEAPTQAEAEALLPAEPYRPPRRTFHQGDV